MRKIYAVLPAKQQSSRLPLKNFRPFIDGLSLLDLKVEQCLKSGVFNEIFISSDAEEAKEAAQATGVHYLHRNERLCSDDTPWADVIKGIATSIPVEDDAYLMWIHVTNPLFWRFEDVVNALEANPANDSVSTVTGYRHFMLNSDFVPINHRWGQWHTYSQTIKPVYQLNLASSLILKSTMIANRYILGDKPYFYEISAFEGLDIDTAEEFQMAAALYPQMLQKSN